MAYPATKGPTARSASRAGLYVYLVFVVSWFLHVPERIPVLGAIRFDLVLVVALTAIYVAQRGRGEDRPTSTDTLLYVLIGYAIVSIPFVEWPGSVVKFGIVMLIKAVVFYFFTVAFVRSEADLRKLVYVFLGCQTIRVLEPLYLHVTEGYWGATTSMGGWEELERLSGAPSDIVNPNGLAFIICTVLPFLYFMSDLSWKHRLAALLIAPACLYALALTGSRSGLIGLAVVCLGILVKSRHRVVLAAAFVVAVAAGFPLLTADMQDRYLSVFGRGEKNALSAVHRMEGTQQQLLVALRRPLFGHGLGTSAEANANFVESGPYAKRPMLAHNLFAEIAIELGLVGLVIFLLFMKSIYSGFVECSRARVPRGAIFVPRLVDAMQVWLAMNFVFSFASYGLTSYEWYLFGGLSVVLRRILRRTAARAGMTAQPAPVRWGLQHAQGRHALEPAAPTASPTSWPGRS